MTSFRRFWIGGGGALLPLLVTVLGVDLSGTIDHLGDYTAGIYVGVFIRYLAMFIAGGIIAALNSDEVRPIKLVQLGIAAPALIATYVNAQSPKEAPAETAPPAHSTAPSGALDFISPAYGMDAKELPKQIVVAGFFSDILKGATNSLPSLNTRKSPPKAANQSALKDAIDAAHKSAAAATAAADKAKAAADEAAAHPSAEATAAAKQAAADAASAAQKAQADLKALQDAAAAVK
jgi:hypothetical protein